MSARMSPTHFKVKSLSGKIFTSVLAFTLAVIVALSVTMTTIYYLSYEHDAETELAASAQDAARYLNATPSSENAPALKEQFSGLTRYTLIDADGTVLFDSAADTDAMDNHADRPEVQEAADMGEAVTMRYSETLGTDTVYAAVKLDGQNPVEAVVKKIPGNQIVLASADSGAEQAFSEISQLQDSSNPYDPFALHKAALIACGIIPYREQISVEEVTKNLGSGLYLSTQVIHIPRGSGLGTSSILAGACVKAIYQMLGKKLSQEELYNRVLCMEQIMSTGGGWQDQVGGLAPGIKMVTSDVAIVQEIGCSPCSISTETLQELNERFCLIYSGQRRLARNLLRDIVSRYVSGNPDTVEVLYEIQRIAVLMRFELEKGNVDGFAQLLNQHWELSKRLDGGCTNTCIDMIFSSVEDLIDGKMICGAGGGGFLQVILKKGVTAEQVQKRLREVFQDSGVEVWRCSLVG